MGSVAIYSQRSDIHLSIKNSYTEWVYVKYLSNKMFWKIDL